jgi:O-antigen/teichoic acid export membrane protein
MVIIDSRDRVGTGVFWQYLSSIVSVLAGALFYIFIIHIFTTEIVGVFALLFAILNLFTTVFLLGLGVGLQHFISYHMGERDDASIRALMKNFILIGFILAIAAFLTLWLTAPYIGLLFFHTLKYLNYIRLLDIELFAMLLNGFLGSMLNGLQNFKKNASILITNYAIGYGLILPFLSIRFDPVMIIFAWITGYYIALIIYAISIFKILGRLPKINKKVNLKTVLTYSIPLFISSLVSYGATYIDRFIVSFLMNLSEMGIYNFSLLIINALSIIISPVSAILLSKLSEFYGRRDMEIFRIYSTKAIEIISAIYMPVALLVAAISPSILLFLANSNYLPGTLPIMIILITGSLTVSGNIFGVTLQAIRKTRIFILTSTLALLSNFILSFALIPFYGINGAAVGYASTGISSFFVVYYYAKKYSTFSIEKIKMAKIFLSSFIMFFLMLFVQMRLGYGVLLLFIYIVTGFAVYLFLIKVFGTFSERDIDLFLSLLPDKFSRLKKFIKSIFI